MPGRVERFLTQRTRWAARGNHSGGACRELARRFQREEHPNGIRTVLGIIENHGCVEFLLAHREQLDNHRVGLGIPAQPHRADPELRVEWCDQRAEVGDVVGVIGFDVAVVESDAAAALSAVTDRMLTLGGEMLTIIAVPELEAEVAAEVERLSDEYPDLEIVTYPIGDGDVMAYVGLE